jgi:hypothetical protein
MYSELTQQCFYLAGIMIIFFVLRRLLPQSTTGEKL